MSNIRTLYPVESEANEQLVSLLESLLEQAREGKLQRLAYAAEGGHQVSFGGAGGVTPALLGAGDLMRDYMLENIQESLYTEE